MTRILVFAGSARKDSFNKKLARAGAEAARSTGAEVTFADLAEFVMPLYDGDLESTEGIPEAAGRFRALLRENEGWMIACPEYNGSITPLLKNTIDWASRPQDGEGTGAVFQGKAAALLSASPGRLGGIRGLVHVRTILHGLGTLVVPGDVSVSAAHQAFGDDGSLTDLGLAERLERSARALVAAGSALDSVRSH